MERLPKDIVELIMSFLDGKSICDTSRVSKYFQTLCEREKNKRVEVKTLYICAFHNGCKQAIDICSRCNLPKCIKSFLYKDCCRCKWLKIIEGHVKFYC